MNWFQLTSILSRPIAFHRIFATIGGGACSGLFLSQAFYWSSRTSDPDGWFYKTKEEWEEETALTRREQDTVREKLRERGLIEEKKQGVPCRLFYRINKETFLAALSEAIAEKQLELPDSHSCTDPPNCGTRSQSQLHRSAKLVAPIRQTSCTDPPNYLYTETTNRDYSETTVVAATAKIPTAAVGVLEPEEEQQKTAHSMEVQAIIPASSTNEPHEDESSGGDAETLREVERIAHNWRLRPWRSSAQYFKPEMIKAVWQCNPGYYSLQGTQTPNQHHILKTLQLLERQLKSGDAAAVNAYHELTRYWQTAEILQNPQVQHAFVAAAAQSKEHLKEVERQRRVQADVEMLKREFGV